MVTPSVSPGESLKLLFVFHHVLTDLDVVWRGE